MHSHLARRVLLVLWVVLVVLRPHPVPASAAPPIQVFVNGSPLAFDVPPAVVEGRTLVPVRAIFEALGVTVGWDSEARAVTATWEGGDLWMPVGARQVRVRGEERAIDVPAQIVNGRTLVPLRFVAETLSAKVGWYGHARVITINRPSRLIPATVVRVVDGDTVEVRTDELIKVRLIGADTPEVYGQAEPYGAEASAFTKQHLPPGLELMLELDLEPYDRYGRTLAYAYLPDGTLYNARLIAEGMAQILTIPPNVRYAQVFLALQAEAREAGRGLWSVTPEPRGPSETGLLYDPFGPDRDCGDFQTQAEAQAFFEAAGGPGADRHRLDSDQDGVVCESLP